MTEATMPVDASPVPEGSEAAARRFRVPRYDRPAVYRPAIDVPGRSRERSARPQIVGEVRQAADTAVMLLTLVGAMALFDVVQLGAGATWTLPAIATLGALAVVWRLIFSLVGLYEETRWSWRDEAPAVAAASAIGLIATLPLILLGGSQLAMAAAAAFPATVFATLAARSALRLVAERASSRTVSKVLIVGSGPLALDLHQRIKAETSSSCEVLGFIDSAPQIRFGEIAQKFLGTLDDLDGYLMNNVVDEVLIALPVKSHYDEVQRVIRICERAGVQARYNADIFKASLGAVRYRPSGSQPAVAVQVVTDDYRLGVKRAIDILGSGLGLLVLAPVFGIIALLIKTTSPGPVFFRQERFGWRKRRFSILKFRTMVENAAALHASLEDRNELGGPVFKIRNDPRVTPLGRFLRQTSLDELPQLWNVLRGEMSLVGPRPLAVRDVHRFDESWLMRRFSVVPGMTGLWQVSGRNNVCFADWAALDLEYIDGWSLGLDARILLRTIPAVVNGVGAH